MEGCRQQCTGYQVKFISVRCSSNAELPGRAASSSTSLVASSDDQTFCDHVGKMVAHVSLGELQGAAQLSSCAIRFIIEYIQQALAGGFHGNIVLKQ